ncbi:ankyrin repeat-containing domain protein [Aspergillus terricola var. indicus]
MILLDLPPELLLSLATFLDAHRDINALSQSNRQLHALLNPYLYQYNSKKPVSSALLSAAKLGKEATARIPIQEGGEIGLKDDHDWTPLFWAVLNGHETVLKLLLETGQADVDPIWGDYWGRTPLSWAAEEEREAVVKLLLETRKVNVNSKDSENMTPFSYAARYGHEAVTVSLCRTAWHGAVVKLLLDAPMVTVDFEDNTGETPLFWAIHHGH